MLRALVLLFVVLPVIDLVVLYRLGERFGFLETIVLALAVGALGAALAKREGLRVLERWNRALTEGRAPEEGVLSSGLLLVAAGLLIVPGFLSDVLGLLLVLPPVRALVARIIRSRFETSIADGRIEVVSFGDLGGHGPMPRGPGAPRNRGGDVIDVVGEDVTDGAKPRPSLPSDRGGSGGPRD